MNLPSCFWFCCCVLQYADVLSSSLQCCGFHFVVGFSDWLICSPITSEGLNFLLCFVLVFCDFVFTVLFLPFLIRWCVHVSRFRWLRWCVALSFQSAFHGSGFHGVAFFLICFCVCVCPGHLQATVQTLALFPLRSSLCIDFLWHFMPFTLEFIICPRIHKHTTNNGRAKYIVSPLQFLMKVFSMNRYRCQNLFSSFQLAGLFHYKQPDEQTRERPKAPEARMLACWGCTTPSWWWKHLSQEHYGLHLITDDISPPFTPTFELWSSEERARPGILTIP